MHSGLDEDHELLRAGLREALAAEDAVGSARALAEGQQPPRDLWGVVAGLGLPGLLVAEEHGGLGLGELELVVAAEELGRAIAAVPFIATAVLGATLLGAAPHVSERLAEVAAGGCRVAVADALADADVHLWRSGRSGILSGDVTSVRHLVGADLVLLVVARDGGVPAVVAVDPGGRGVHCKAEATLDATCPQGRLSLFDVAVEDRDVVVADASNAWATAHRRRLLAASAEAVGVGAAAVDIGVAEGRTHEQFGRAIGAFQAVAHPLVEAWAAVERARSMVYAAGAAAAAGRRDADHLAVCARALAVPAARQATETAIQVHGAVGYTWDHDLHLFYRRARAAEHDDGSSTAVAERQALAGVTG